jgi:hypothetical protein
LNKSSIIEKYSTVDKDTKFICEDGWLPLIDDLLSSIENIIRDCKIELNISHLSCEFGELAIVFSKENLGDASEDIIKKIHKIIRCYKRDSRNICEICGDPGSLYDFVDTVKTRCSKCVDDDYSKRMFIHDNYVFEP